MTSRLWVAALAVGCACGAVVEIDASKPADYRIPRTIYGTFLEPIGQSIYPGLWAQLLENPSFEDNLWSAGRIQQMLNREPALVDSSKIGLPLPWRPLDAAHGVRYEPRWGDAANSSRSLFVMGLTGKQVGVRQQIYPPVHRVLDYRGSVYVKRVVGTGAVEVSFRKGDEVLARSTVETQGAGWRRYEFRLQLPKGRLARLDPVDFAIAISGEARVLLDQVLIFPADAVDGMDPEMIEMTRAMKSPVVRFGGNFTSGYHFRDGIGPMDKRPTMLNQSWGMPEYNHFGTDEFLQFCKLTGAEPQIALNLGSGTPEEAADWVRHVNQRWSKHSGLLWELGNELWGASFQIGAVPVDRIAPRTREFSEAVRRVDPQARLIATGNDPDRFREWNGRQIASPAGTFQYLSTHFVVGVTDTVKRDASPESIARAGFALPVGLERALRQMREQIEADDKTRGKVRIAFTEWLFHGNAERGPQFSNMGGAVCTAGFLNMLMRVADFVPISDMTGNIEFGGVWKKRGQVYGVPAYWAFRMYSNADATVPVQVKTEVERYDVHEGVRRIPEIASVPYLDVVAALNATSDRLTLFCVNRHPGEAIEASLRIRGFAAAGQARVEQLRSGSIYDRNDEARPEAVRPVVSTVAARPDGLVYSFPGASVTLIELRRR